jgi:hypothetical protein
VSAPPSASKRRRGPHGGPSLAERMDAESKARAGRRTVASGGGSVSADRAELLAEQRRRAASRTEQPAPQTRLELERSRLVAMERRLERWGAECRTATPETVKVQRQLVARLEAEPPEPAPAGAASRPLTAAERAEASRPAVYRGNPITWLREPVTLYPGSRIRVVGYDPAMISWPPAWLPDAEEAA